ncbi:MAG: serine/threonine-protein kinase [Polyangiaceae bacterium]|nr:serine/threonine-protein kinase [Polyangiaceae bacterium]
MASQQEGKPQPVYIIERIPAGGANGVSDAEAKSEGIPTPPGLRVFAELGRGGMGRIHPATDRNLLRHVALKRLDKELAKEPFYRGGFIGEAQITGQLEHPNIVPVHELAISDDGVPYFTMKLVRGSDLHRWLSSSKRRRGTTERLQEGLEVFLKVCDALAYAHHRGVIHRDIKPENIMVADFGQVYMMDWGLARLIGKDSGCAALDAPGAVGTSAYMAPEQAKGNPIELDERADVFGMGAILYEIISGHTPYGDTYDADEALRRAAQAEIIPIDMACEGIGVSRRIRRIVEKAVAPKREDRYQSILELQNDVRAFLRGGLHLPRQLFQPSELIIREGAVGTEAYMIVSGRVRAFRRVESGEETLAEMAPGDVFGEMALLLEEPRAASVEAIEPTTVLVLDKKTMEDGLGTDGWTGALVRALAGRFRNLEQKVRESGIKR